MAAIDVFAEVSAVPVRVDFAALRSAFRDWIRVAMELRILVARSLLDGAMVCLRRVTESYMVSEGVEGCMKVEQCCE